MDRHGRKKKKKKGISQSRNLVPIVMLVRACYPTVLVPSGRTQKSSYFLFFLDGRFDPKKYPGGISIREEAER